MSAANPLSLLSPATSVLNTANSSKSQPVQDGAESNYDVSFAAEFDNATAVLTTSGQQLIAQENADFSAQLGISLETEAMLSQDLVDAENENNLIVDSELLVNPQEQVFVSPLTEFSFLASQVQLNPIATNTPITPPDASLLNTIPPAFEATGLSSASALVLGQTQKATGLNLNELVPELLAETNKEGNKASDPSASMLSADDTEEPVTNNFFLAKNKTQQEGVAAPTATNVSGLPDVDMQDNQNSQKINGAATAAEMNMRLADSSASIPRNFVVQTQVPVSVAQPQWGQAVGEKVLWLAAQNVSSAEIKLDPPELGSLQVKVSLHQEQASVTFVSPHATVRDALDQQMQRLRDMFQEQGIALLHVDVSDKSFSRQRKHSEDENKQHPSASEEDLTPVGVTELSSRATHLIDHYA